MTMRDALQGAEAFCEVLLIQIEVALCAHARSGQSV